MTECHRERDSQIEGNRRETKIRLGLTTIINYMAYKEFTKRNIAFFESLVSKIKSVCVVCVFGLKNQDWLRKQKDPQGKLSKMNVT